MDVSYCLWYEEGVLFIPIRRQDFRKLNEYVAAKPAPAHDACLAAQLLQQGAH